MPRSIPVYDLYGEPRAGFGADLLHCETLASRSRRHGFVIRAHRHATLFQLLYARSGPVEMSLEGASLTIESPCLLTVPPLVVHGFRFNESIDGWIVSVPEAKLALLFAAEPMLLDEMNKVHVLDARQIGDAAPEVEALLVRIADEFTDLGRGRWLAMQACLVLALVRLDRYAGAGRRDADGPSERALQHARRFRRQVEDWFCERRPLKDYARALAITPTQLNRVCQVAFGRSALQVIHDRLLLEAQHELVHSPTGMREIGYDLGFDDPAYFTRFFTKRIGMSPLAFRELYRQQQSPGHSAVT